MAIREFTDLKAWKEGHKLVLAVYQQTQLFPDFEKYGLANQLRKAAVSVTSNIAEGFGRRSYKEKIRFYYLAHGSIVEVKNQLLIARDIGYFGVDVYTSIIKQLQSAHQLLRGLITSSESFVIHDS